MTDLTTRIAALEAAEAKATPGFWEAQATQRDGEDRGVCIIGLRLGDDDKPLYTPTNGIVAAALPSPTEIDDNDYERVEANAALIVALRNNALPIIREQQAEIARLREALTPSGHTKAAYIGEFSFAVEISHPRLGGEQRRVDVPWTTIKEIMAAIRERAALNERTGA